MRTKQEVVNFLESKVGGGVECKGNPSLNSQCVTLIKSLMEFLGVPGPYKARGHAKTAISAYLSEGIAKPGLGFISVFSNKDMGQGYGHIWIGIDNTFYESNGAKPLTVTKGKTYSYDSVCNFDQYISEPINKELAECNLHKTNLQNQVNGLLKDIESQKGVISDTETKLGTANGRIQELTKQNENLSVELGSVRGDLSATLAKVESLNNVVGQYQKDDAVQLETIKTYERERNEYKNAYLGLIGDIREELKLSGTVTDTEVAINEALASLQSLYQMSEVYENKVQTLEDQVKKLTTQSRHISKLSIKDCIIILIDKIKEKYGKK